MTTATTVMCPSKVFKTRSRRSLSRMLSIGDAVRLQKMVLPSDFRLQRLEPGNIVRKLPIRWSEEVNPSLRVDAEPLKEHPGPPCGPWIEATIPLSDMLHDVEARQGLSLIHI